ncbi:hypothetical protein, partial [uncultured Methylobacterium sp.]|uniref:hypothetical protein n=1 Tax=uncultured Methylobacterium sp. TaxID=157278 RepID=UPI0035CCA68D
KDLYARLVEIAGGSAGLSVAVALPAPAESTEPASEAERPSKAEAPAAAAPTPYADEPGDTPAVTQEDAAPSSAAAEPKDAPAAAVAPPRPGAHIFVGAPLPGERDQIGLGSIVLAHEGPEDGWWEAEVIGCNGRVFSLRWRDFPTQPTILRKAGELALLPPGEV